MRNTFVGFDSAWADKAPGAVCFAAFDDDRLADWQLPEPAHFADVLEVVERCRTEASYTLVAVDQPTMVPNATGMRPVERVAGSVKTGVQPAYLNKPLFGHSAPIWTFLDALSPSEDPCEAQNAESGLHLIEVFPALALAGLFGDRRCRLPLALHYNPGNPAKFSMEDWRLVADCTRSHSRKLNLGPFVDWAARQADNPNPSKADQDCLDALICLVIALKWRRRHPDTAVLGDWRGHMVTPLSAEAKARIDKKVHRLGVPVTRGSWKLHEAVLGYFDGKHYDAFEWLAHPNPALGGESPLTRAGTPDGMQDVLDLVGRQAHGIPT